MKKLVALSSLVLAAGLTFPAVALAQDDQPPSCAEALVALNEAQADLDEVPATVPNPALPELRARHEVAVKAAIAVGFPEVDQTQAQLERLRGIAAEGDSNRADEQSDEQENAEAQPKVIALEAVFAAKDDLDTAPAEVPNPALEAATKKRDEAKAAADDACRGPQGEPGFVDLDCTDFPLPDGRTAQDVLDETPGADPHGLDANANRVACESGELTGNSDQGGNVGGGNTTPDGGDFDQVGELPTTINTGRA